MSANTWNAYWRLMRFDRPIGIMLLLWPTWWGLFVAGRGSPSLRNLLIFTMGVVVMRAAGCVMNDIADRNFDPHVQRTRMRPLAAGELQLRQAIGCFLVLMLIALALVLQTNLLTVQLSLIGAVVAASYPFFKRFTHLPQVVLGIAFGWGIPMAFAAETGSVDPLAWWLFGINVTWSLIYDTLYAMVDREDDLRIGVKSTAILFGRFDVPVLAVLMLAMLSLLTAVGLQAGWNWPWFGGVLVTAVLFASQLWRIRARNPEACFRAFLQNNWVGAVIFAGLLASFHLPGMA